MNSLSGRIIAYLFLGLFCLVGPALLLFAAGTGVSRALFVHSSLSADGVVVALRPRATRSSKYSWMPVFRFTTQDGRTFTVTSNIAQSPSPWKFGDHVPVLYQRDHPENAHIDSFFQLWAPQVIVGTVGAGFSTIPLLILLRRRRSNT